MIKITDIFKGEKGLQCHENEKQIIYELCMYRYALIYVFILCRFKLTNTNWIFYTTRMDIYD